MILKRICPTILFCACLSALCLPVPAATADSATSPPPKSDSRPKSHQAPAIYGFRLGMAQDQLLGRFREFPGLAALSGDGSAVMNLADREKQPAVRGVRSLSGLIELEVYPPYLTARHGGKLESIRGGHLYLLVRDGKLAVIRLVDVRSDSWHDLDGFIKEMSRRYGIKMTSKSTPQPTGSSAPDGVPPDFAARTVEGTFSGYSIACSCVGPPAPPGMCDLWLKAVDRPRERK